MNKDQRGEPKKVELPAPGSRWKASANSISTRALQTTQITSSLVERLEKSWHTVGLGNSWKSISLIVLVTGVGAFLTIQSWHLSAGGMGAFNQDDEIGAFDDASLNSPRTIAENFIYARTVEERLPWIRDAAIHENDIREFFEAYGKSRANRVVSIAPILDGTIHQNISQQYQVRFADGRSRLLCIMDDPPLVDWEAYSRKGTATWSELLDGSAQSAEVRVFLSFKEHAAVVLSDSIVSCMVLGIRSPDCQESLYGLVELESRRCSLLKEIIPMEPAKSKRMTIQIESRNDSYKRREFFIAKIVALGWVRGRSVVYEDSKILPEDGGYSLPEKLSRSARDKMNRVKRRQQGLDGLIKAPR